MSGQHIPVMLDEVVAALSPCDGEVYVDGTFGAGGYTRAFLESADCTVIAIDRDPDAQKRAQAFEKEFGSRFIFLYGCFGDALELVRAAGFEKVDGFVLDIGVSSFQIDEALRGFSFAKDGPLDMRMDTRQGLTAADIVNTYDETDLANLIYQLGDERHSRKIARRIVAKREEKKFETTLELADLIRSVIPRSPKDKTDPATRSFQALRIAVNDELGELQRGLESAQSLLSEGGRLVVVSFHSLEDGIVKSFLYERSGRIAGGSRHLPPVSTDTSSSPLFHVKQRKAISANNNEASNNPRARSAKLRWAVRSGVAG